jgi:serine/threonine-protein kinase HipA
MKSPELLHVFAGTRLAGTLARERGSYVFTYAHDASSSEQVCLSMPVRTSSYVYNDLHPIFQMNLPEGYLREKLEYRLAKLTDLDPMNLLALTGSVCPIGRLRYINPALPVDQPTQGESLDEILKWSGSENLFSALVNKYILRSAISGVQPKVIVPIQSKQQDDDNEPTRPTLTTDDWIIKSGNNEYPHLAINEFLCMNIAKEAGCIVPEFYLSNDATIFAMRRFDRDVNNNQIGFEDMTVVMRLLPKEKYSKSYELIAKAIDLYCENGDHREVAKQQLFDLVALSCIVGNGDAHLKNFGFVYPTPDLQQVRLAPAYDIVNTTAYISEDQLALSLNGNKSLFASREGIIAFAKTLNIPNYKSRIQDILGAAELVLTNEKDLIDQAPAIAASINNSIEPYRRTFV